jgi:hypothetical protein
LVSSSQRRAHWVTSCEWSVTVQRRALNLPQIVLELHIINCLLFKQIVLISRELSSINIKRKGSDIIVKKYNFFVKCVWFIQVPELIYLIGLTPLYEMIIHMLIYSGYTLKIFLNLSSLHSLSSYFLIDHTIFLEKLRKYEPYSWHLFIW